ncbi:hypothetical protein M9458_052054 [Cirrhinus mrigala]|uniref:Integrase catalytic domain-containing protein n=1 Tax=Cirrhinus mrigala TaxID=683832 RepID=A0ABD0MUW7_CIRMR
MDLVGRVTGTKKGNEYICVLVDYYTKWAEAYAIPNKSAAVVALHHQLLYRFGAPKRILPDQGTEFVNQISRELCAFLSVERSLCAPYHPQTNGLVEKVNGTIQRALCKLVELQPEKWDEYLDAVMFGLRIKTQLTTRYSSFFLMFGMEARYPCEVPETSEQKTLPEGPRKNIMTQQRKGGSLSAAGWGHMILLQDEPQLKRPHEETGQHPSPTPVDITITKEKQPPPSRPSSPTAPKLSPCVSPKSSSCPSPLDLSMPLSSPVSRTTTVPTVIPADAKYAVHSYIKSAWAGNDSIVLLSKVGPHKLFYQDILQVGPGKELESEVVNPTSYCHLNAAVPILRLYLDEAADHRAHLRLSLPSIRSLIGALRLESDHGWERDIEVLVFLYWLAHASSYKVVSQTFDIPKTSVHDIVHRVSKA